MKKVLVICGPTGVGKTSCSIELAKRLNGEIINGDSMQVYQEMNIGTAKISKEERAIVPHHLFDIISVKDSFSVASFQQLVRAKIDEITERGNLPIIVGGTGLYLKASLYDYVFEPKKGDTQDYSNISTEDLYKRITEVDSLTAGTIHPNNRKRIIRAIELFNETGVGKEKINQSQEHKPIYDVIFIGLTRKREDLYNNINARVDKMFLEGLEEEARRVLLIAPPQSTARQAIGYKEFLEDLDIESIKEKIKANTRKFAKRQYTWFNHQMDTRWVDVDDLDTNEVVSKVLEQLKGWK